MARGASGGRESSTLPLAHWQHLQKMPAWDLKKDTILVRLSDRLLIRTAMPPGQDLTGIRCDTSLHR